MKYLITVMVVGVCLLGGCENKELLQCQQDYATLQQEREALNETLTTLLNKFKQTVDENETLQGQVTKLAQERENLIQRRQEDRQQMNKALLECQGQIAAMKQQAQTAQNKAASLEKELSECKGQMTGLQSELGRAKEGAQSAEKRIKDLQGAHAQLKQQAEQLQGEVKELEAKLKEAAPPAGGEG